jgi:4-alpha-glucanotransferase
VNDLDVRLRQLADAYGVATDFWDWQGRHVDVSPETIAATLTALGLEVSTREAADAALAEHRIAPWRRTLPPVVVAREGGTPTVFVHVTHGEPVELWIDLESGGTRQGLRQLENWASPREVDGRLVGEASFEVPGDLPLGYHLLQARSSDVEASTTLIVTPTWVGVPRRMGHRREWGLATQLYSVRSRRSWGFGDLGDLADLAAWSAADHGAGFVLVNPLHAAEPVSPIEPSPYLPTSRRFVNPLYLRVELVPEYAYVDDAGRQKIADLHAKVHAALDDVDRIDRDTVWTAKRAALQIVHDVPRSGGRDAAYRAYVRREGQGLTDYATWCAIAETHGADRATWPDPLRHPRSPAVADFRAEHPHRVDFHRWLQWLLDEQLAGTQAAARRAGMTLGIMHDLAVGVHPRGADAWILQDVFACGITVGAPPDAFNQAGQDWTQRPWRPDRLAEVAYQPLRDVFGTIVRHAGGVRIDHIIGLFRLWWIPAGMPPTAGTYVRYDHEAMIGILALEAQRAQAVIVGEDLGTVEPWVRDYLRERGILGTSILWFEFEWHARGAPLRPEWWREYCLASVTTHDLPPTAGYLASDHVRLRHELGLLTRSIDEELAADEAERRAWIDNLTSRHALREQDTGDVEATVQALHRYLTWTPARLLGVSLSDAVGDRRGQNQPGTIDQYPNWRMPLAGPDGRSMLLEDVMASRRVADLAAVVAGRDRPADR